MFWEFLDASKRPLSGMFESAAYTFTAGYFYGFMIGTLVSKREGFFSVAVCVEWSPCSDWFVTRHVLQPDTTTKMHRTHDIEFVRFINWFFKGTFWSIFRHWSTFLHDIFPFFMDLAGFATSFIIYSSVWPVLPLSLTAFAIMCASFWGYC